MNTKFQNGPILDGVGDGVGVQPFFEDVPGGFRALDLSFNVMHRRVFIKDRCAGKTEELRVGKEGLDRLVPVSELGAVALVEDEHHPFVAQGSELLCMSVPAIQGPAQFLNGRDNHLVRVIV